MAQKQKFTPRRIALLSACLAGLCAASAALFLLVRHNGMMEEPFTAIGATVSTLLLILGLNRLAFRRATTPEARKEAKEKASLTCFIGGWMLVILIAAGLSQ